MSALHIILLACVLGAAQGGGQDARTWTSDFNLTGDELRSTGRNPYFVLEPGYVLELASGPDHLTITVLSETRRIQNVEARIVEERETHDGNIVEVSRNYYAISTRTNSVFYFGEDVDTYKNGKIVNHEGSWIAGEKGAKPGLMMPGLPLLKARYYEEVAPGLAMDRAEIVSLSETLKTPAGDFSQVLKIAESTPLEPGSSENKFYAPGVGLIQDGALKLVRYH